MSMKHYFCGILSALLFQSCFAKPPFEVMSSCIDEEPKNANVIITDIDNGSYATHPEKNCEDQFEITFNHELYGAVVCSDKRYFIIAKQKINLDTAENMSINPEIKPGILYPEDSSWLKVDFNNKSYLCVNGPISRSGTGSSIGQYYIIESAFEKNERPKVYYYFLNKDIVPITSDHL